MKKIELESGVLEYIFKACKPFLSKDETRPILKTIKFEIEEKVLRAIAVDGYKMTVIEVLHNNPNVEPFECCIKPFALPKDIMDSTILLDEKDIKETNIIFRLYGGNTMKYSFLSIPTEHFINWRNVMPEANEDLSFNLDAKMLAKAVDVMGNNEKKYLKISFVGDNSINKTKPIKLETEKPNIKVSSIILPVRVL